MKVLSFRDYAGRAQIERRSSVEAVTPAEGRALVALAPAAPSEREPALSYRPASFLSQLIANKDQLPQTRERRRVDPSEAVLAYQTAMVARPAQPTLSRSL